MVARIFSHMHSHVSIHTCMHMSVQMHLHRLICEPWRMIIHTFTSCRSNVCISFEWNKTSHECKLHCIKYCGLRPLSSAARAKASGKSQGQRQGPRPAARTKPSGKDQGQRQEPSPAARTKASGKGQGQRQGPRPAARATASGKGQLTRTATSKDHIYCIKRTCCS